MFENVLGQAIIGQLESDIAGGTLAPSILFSGPQASGKGSAALELGRILSCENSAERGAWNCACPACARHRQLSHPDLLLLGPRAFAAEIAASAAAFLRDPSAGATRFLFVRSVRKLLARFSPVLWEDDPKIAKLNPLIQSLDEGLDDLGTGDADALKKAVDAIVKNSFKLESEGVADQIPVGHVRRAAYWSRLAPQGRRKLLVIENADRMQDAARNSLLKILEEPPDTVTIVLATARHDALLPTILSRVRPYRFVARDNAAEAEVIRKIFRDSRPPDLGTAPAMLRRYLDSFLPVSAETLYPLAALFVASVAMGSALGLKRGGADLGDALVSLGKHAAPIAENAGLGRPLGDIKSLTAKTLEGADNFSLRSRFSQFLQAVLALVGESLAASAAAATDAVACREAWLAAAREAEAAVGTYNLSPAIALDRLAYEVRRSMVLQAQP